MARADLFTFPISNFGIWNSDEQPELADNLMAGLLPFQLKPITEHPDRLVATWQNTTMARTIVFDKKMGGMPSLAIIKVAERAMTQQKRLPSRDLLQVIAKRHGSNLKRTNGCRTTVYFAKWAIHGERARLPSYEFISSGYLGRRLPRCQ